MRNRCQDWRLAQWYFGKLAINEVNPGTPWGPSETLGNASTIASLVPTVIEYRRNAYVNPVGSSILVWLSFGTICRGSVDVTARHELSYSNIDPNGLGWLTSLGDM